MATIFFAGHEASKLCGFDKTRYAVVRQQLIDLIKYLHEDMGYDTFITGGAQGIDQLVFCAVHEYKQQNPNMHVRNVVYAPFPGHESKWPRYGAFSQFEYGEILKMADSVHYTKNAKPLTKQKAIQALYERNVEMLHDSDALCAFIPEIELNEQNTHSGTKSCVNVAKQFARKIFCVDYQITYEGMKLIGLK